MQASLHPHLPILGHDLTCDLLVIFERARTMQRRGWHPFLQTQLKGKKLALLSARASGGPPLFQEAAEALGAQQSVKEIQRTARVLGWFYDAVNCEGIDSEIVGLLQKSAERPVFDDLCSERHCVAHLADLLDPQSSIEENRRWVVMSALVSALD
jgi:ornithine carbamoyltransferase